MRPAITLFVAALLMLAACAALAQNAAIDPFGDCCVAKVVMKTFDSWDATCGTCAENGGVYRIMQPDPEKNVYVDAKGQTGDSPYDLARKLCICPSLDRERALRRSLRLYHGN